MKFMTGTRYRVFNDAGTDEFTTRDKTYYPIVLGRKGGDVELDDTLWGHDTRKVEVVNGVEVIKDVYRLYGEKWHIYADKPLVDTYLYH